MALDKGNAELKGSTFEAIGSEAELAAVAETLAGFSDSQFEIMLQTTREVGEPSPDLVRSLVNQIKEGEDPLGDAFIRLRSAATRRQVGATYTPKPIIDSMVAWAAQQGIPDRIVDPGAGSGRYILAAARRFPNAQLIAIDIDPLATLLLRASARVIGIEDRVRVVLQDYRSVNLPIIQGRTLFIGNPPYVRHHDISVAWKEWFGGAAKRLGYRASKLAGLHVHFFFKTAELARPGDYGSFITASEWLDVNYGSALRKLLTDQLSLVGLHAFSPAAMPFNGATVTGAIANFIMGSGSSVQVRLVNALDELGDLSKGKRVARASLRSTDRWTTLISPPRRRFSGQTRLGDLFRVHRGQVTGANRVWIHGAYKGEVPEAYLFPTVTRAREIISAAPILASIENLRRVIDLPPDLSCVESADLENVEEFLRWAEAQGVRQGYVARHRKAWWSVGLREPAPVLVTYMARRPPVFVHNSVGARHINIAHGLYPREPIGFLELEAIVHWLNHYTSVDQGRTYAGGLTKFEPRELERLPLPPLQELYERAARLETRRAGN